jgi:hypothetical protein
MKMETRKGERTGRLVGRRGPSGEHFARQDGGQRRPFPTLHSFHSGAGSERPGAVKGAPFFRRGAGEPLKARTALKSWRGEGKDDTSTKSEYSQPGARRENQADKMFYKRGHR